MIKKYSNAIWLALIAVAIILVFLFAPKTYDWSVTFDHDDSQPFGCSLFDDAMTRSLPRGYEVIEDFSDSINPETSAVIYLKNNIGWSPYDTLAIRTELKRARGLVDFVRKGGVLILATGEIKDYGWGSIHKIYGLDDDDVRHTSPHYENELSDFVEECREYKQFNLEAKWVDDDSTFLVQPFMLFYHKMADYYVEGRYKPLLTYYNGDADETFTVAFSRKLDKGVIEYVSVPLFFSNYGITDRKASLVADRLLRPVAGRHVYRMIGRNEEMQVKQAENTGEFSYLISRPALRWALYLSMIVLVIFCIFTARRRMRAIPLPQQTTNSTFEFAKYMGTYYFSRHSHSKPVTAKYKGLMQDVSDYYGWDVENMSNQDLADGLAEKTGESSEKIIQLIRTVNSFSHGHDITQKSMMELIDYITLLKKKL